MVFIVFSANLQTMIVIPKKNLHFMPFQDAEEGILSFHWNAVGIALESRWHFIGKPTAFQ